MAVKKYRVNSSEHFNLFSMYEKLKCQEIDLYEGTVPYSEKAADELEARIEEVERLMDAAPYVGALVDWPTLKRIREIKDERQMIRYATCLAQGTPEREAALAFDV